MSDLVERLRSLGPDKSGFREIGVKSADEIERLSKLFIAAYSTIELLESNARVQAKLLADTGRERDELRKQLEAAEKISLGTIADLGIVEAQVASLRKQLVSAVADERERCARICDDWVAKFGKGSIEYVPATEYATDAVCDIADLIRQPSAQTDDTGKP